MPLISPRSLKPVERLLAQAERSIALISRCRPTNAAVEEARLNQHWAQGRRESPRFSYAQVPELGGLRRQLDQVCQVLPRGDPISELYVLRAEELSLETQMVEKIGTREFGVLSARRFLPRSPVEAAQVEALAAEWSRLTADDSELTYRSDDSASPQSLLTRIRVLVGELKLPVVVELTDCLTAAAATGERTIFIARDRQLTSDAAARIAHHEVYGHALPRVRASQEELGLFAIGSARGNDEQEGYALWLEESAGLMGNSRKRELAWRHLAACGVQRGVKFVDTVEMLRERGAALRLGLQIAARTHRAGGLAREVVYLPALCRVRLAFEREPELVEWMQRGRVSLEAVSVLRAHLSANSATTGT